MVFLCCSLWFPVFRSVFLCSSAAGCELVGLLLGLAPHQDLHRHPLRRAVRWPGRWEPDGRAIHVSSVPSTSVWWFGDSTILQRLGIVIIQDIQERWIPNLRNKSPWVQWNDREILKTAHVRAADRVENGDSMVLLVGTCRDLSLRNEDWMMV